MKKTDMGSYLTSIFSIMGKCMYDQVYSDHEILYTGK